MLGLQHTYTRPNGQIVAKMIIVILMVAICLTGCSDAFMDWLVGDGRGDWKIELINDFYIFQTNTYSISLTIYNPEVGNYSYALDEKCYITSYQLQDPYIYVMGIPYEGDAITESEWQNTPTVFYCVNSLTREAVGPFDTEVALQEYCSATGLHISDKWLDCG